MRLKRAMVCALAFDGLVGLLPASASLVSFGPDGVGVGRVLSDVSSSAAVAVAVLGDGSVTYNGGLVYSSAASSYFAIGNDSLGSSKLVSFASSTPSTLALNVGLSVGGFTGGLALNGSTLYAISTDFTGTSSLYSLNLAGGGLSLLGTLGGALYTGLAYDSKDGQLYGIAADAMGVSRSVRRISLTGSVSDSELFLLGDGSEAFNGGLAYDDQADLFSVIGNDMLAHSSLMSFDLTGAGSLAALHTNFGDGFVNAGLAFAPTSGGGGGGGGGGTVPEPSTMMLLLALCIPWIASRRLHGWR